MSRQDQQERPPPRPPRRARRLGVAVSLAGHLAILAALLWAPVKPLPPPPEEPPPLIVSLVATPAPPPGGSSGAAAAAAAAATVAAATPAPIPIPTPRPPTPIRPRPARPMPVPADVEPLPVSPPAPAPVTLAELSDAQLVGAITAGSGSGAGGGSGSGAGSGSGSGAGSGSGTSCDMVRRLQAALRKDPDIQAAAAQAQRGGTGKAMIVWNGDWVLSPGQEGKGLAGVRQAIVMEVAFAPEACRADPVRGRVLLSLNDAPGSARLVLGSGTWRWSDLLSARGTARVTRW